jgi:hypothetical protein
VLDTEDSFNCFLQRLSQIFFFPTKYLGRYSHLDTMMLTHVNQNGKAIPVTARGGP